MLDNFSIWIFAPKMTQNSRTLIWKRVDCPIFFQMPNFISFLWRFSFTLYLFISFFPYVQHYWKVFISSASNIELQERDKFVAKVEKPSKSYKMWNNAKKSNRHLHWVWKSCPKSLILQHLRAKRATIWIFMPKVIQLNFGVKFKWDHFC